MADSARCKAHITKEYKKRKADSVWPETVYGPNEDAKNYPACDGELTFTVYALSGCGCCGGGIEVEVECSRCETPFYRGSLETFSVKHLLQKALTAYAKG